MGTLTRSPDASHSLDQPGDRRDTVITADALHRQRDHVTHLADGILSVTANQPSPHTQLAGLPWQAVPDAIIAQASEARLPAPTDRGHGRRDIRTLKSSPSPPGSGSRTPPQRCRSAAGAALDKPKRFTTPNRLRGQQPAPPRDQTRASAAWIRDHWTIENKIHYVRDVTHDEDHYQIRTGTGP